MAGHLIGQGHDPGEERRSLARAARRIPTGGLAGEALIQIDRPVAGRAHGDIRHPTLPSDYRGYGVLVGRTAEDDRLSPAARKRVRPSVPEDVFLGR